MPLASVSSPESWPASLYRSPKAASVRLEPAAKPIKLADGGGMYLLLRPDGSRYWRLDYRFDGKRKTLALGVYPEVGLDEARRRRSAAKSLLAARQDPAAVKKAGKLGNPVAQQ